MIRANAEVQDRTPLSMDQAVPTAPLPRQTYRQRQVDELFDLYDLVMIDRLLKGHPTLEKLIGS